MKNSLIPQHYHWLLKEPGPKMIIHGMELYGLKEIPGEESNSVIMEMAAHFGLDDNIYTNDDTAWCALAHAWIAVKAGKEVNLKGYDLLRAKSFATWGKEIVTPMLGDTLVFQRSGGFHVGIYVAEDETAYHVLGGNQSNAYNIMRLEKKRLFAARRPIYSIAMPSNVRQVFVSPKGILSKNEA